MSEEEKARVWVFGIVPADAQLEELEGRDDLPEVWIVEKGDVAAIVGDAPEDDPKATRNQALAHARVLEAAVRDAPVVPMRFGIMCPSDEDVANGILEERHDQLAELLDRFRDSVQMVLKVNYDEQAMLRDIVDEEPDAAGLLEAIRESPEELTRDQRVQLGELIAKTLEQRRERDSADLLEHLDGVTLETRSEPPEKEWMVLNAPLLVERGRIEEVETTVEEVAGDRAERMHFRLIGPMPVYHFLEAEAEDPAAT
jgi:Gas vesicle synthesis protein GvpL/GvpF